MSGLEFATNPIVATLAASNVTAPNPRSNVDQNRKAPSKPPKRRAPPVPPLPLPSSSPPASFKTPNILTARGALVGQKTSQRDAAGKDEELEEWSPEALDHHPHSTVRTPLPAAAEESQESEPAMLFPDPEPRSVVPGRVASLVSQRLPVAPSPIDEDQAWRPVITASSGVRPPPSRPKSCKGPRRETSTALPPSCRDSPPVTARSKRAPRIKEGSWGHKRNTPRRDHKTVEDGLDDTLMSVQLRNGLPLKDMRGSAEHNPSMSKKKPAAPMPRTRESRSRNSSNGSEFEFDQEFDGTGFQHTNKHSVTKKDNSPEKCIIS